MKEELREISDALNKDSSRDAVFSYSVLFVVVIVFTILGVVLWGVVKSLESSMSSMSKDMKNMSVYMDRMHQDIGDISDYIQIIEENTKSMSSDFSHVKKELKVMNLSLIHI